MGSRDISLACGVDYAGRHKMRKRNFFDGQLYSIYLWLSYSLIRISIPDSFVQHLKGNFRDYPPSPSQNFWAFSLCE